MNGRNTTLVLLGLSCCFVFLAFHCFWKFFEIGGYSKIRASPISAILLTSVYFITLGWISSQSTMIAVTGPMFPFCLAEFAKRNDPGWWENPQ